MPKGRPKGSKNKTKEVKKMFGFKKKQEVKTFIDGMIQPPEATPQELAEMAKNEEEYRRMAAKDQPTPPSPAAEPASAPLGNYIEATIELAKLPAVLLVRICADNRIYPALLRIDRHGRVTLDKADMEHEW